MENEANGPRVYAAICAVTGDLAKEGISKDRQNQQQGYKFRGIDDVYNALASLLAKHKLCILPRVVSREQVERQTKTGGALFYTVVHVEYDFVSGEDGSKHPCSTYGEAMDSADKSTNKAMSAAYKYLAMQAFCIPTEGEDADATTHAVAGRSQPQAPPAPRPQQAPKPQPAADPKTEAAKQPAKPATTGKVHYEPDDSPELKVAMTDFVAAGTFERLKMFGALKSAISRMESDTEARNYYRILKGTGDVAHSDEFKKLDVAAKTFRAVWLYAARVKASMNPPEPPPEAA